MELFVLIVVGALVVAAPLLLLLRFTPYYTRVKTAELEERDRLKRVVAEYAAAGMHVEESVLAEYCVSGHHAGVSFEHRSIASGSRGSAAQAIIAISTTDPGTFTIMLETIPSDETIQNNKSCRYGSTGPYVGAVLGVQKNIDALRALLAQGFESVEKEMTRLVAVKPMPAPTWRNPVDITALLSLSESRPAVELLAALRVPPCCE